MITNDIVRKLHAVVFALDKVEVRGRENMDALLGSIQAIEQVAAQIDRYLKQTQTKAEPEITIEQVPEPEEPAE